MWHRNAIRLTRVRLVEAAWSDTAPTSDGGGETAAALSPRLEFRRSSVKCGSTVTPDFPKKTKCIPICMPGSSFMHIVT
jgi:hypothetical protein